MRSLVCLALLIGCGNAFAECRSDIPAFDPLKRFEVLPDGTAKDKVTGLIWLRCDSGTELDMDSGHCTGAQNSPSYTWSEALKLARDLNDQALLGHSDWRVPNIKELGSLVQHNCTAPKIDHQIFISPRNGYWSSTPSRRVERMPSTFEVVDGQTVETKGAITNAAWMLDFQDGKENRRALNMKFSLRLVRGPNP